MESNRNLSFLWEVNQGLMNFWAKLVRRIRCCHRISHLSSDSQITIARSKWILWSFSITVSFTVSFYFFAGRVPRPTKQPRRTTAKTCAKNCNTFIIRFRTIFQAIRTAGICASRQTRSLQRFCLRLQTVTRKRTTSEAFAGIWRAFTIRMLRQIGLEFQNTESSSKFRRVRK